MRVLKSLIATLLVVPALLFTSCDDKNNPPTVLTVTSSVPIQGAVDVPITTPIEFNFNAEMNANTINETTITVLEGTTALAGDVTYANKTATFNPTADLDYNKTFVATVSVGATSADGIALANAFSLTFTTSIAIDNAAPIINSTAPLNDAQDVPRNKTVSIVFNEAMDPATVNANTFTLKQGTSAIVGEVAYSGTTATFTSNTNLGANQQYTATITSGAHDVSGNPLASNTSWDFRTGGTAAILASVNLRSAGNYVILAKTAINNSSTSAITGHLGLSPAATSYITGLALVDFTGYATSAQVTGNVYAADMADPTPVTLTTAVSDMITAYNDAAGRPSPDFLELGTGNIGGMTLEAGLYKWTNTVTIPTDLTLTGGANDVWIFQIAGDLTQSAAVRITLNGGAQAKNIYWQVAGQATFGTTSHFEGNILSMTGITFLTTASMTGRALAQTAVILDANAITKVQ
jgi:hypothetical protein